MLGPMLRAAAGNAGTSAPMDYIARWDMAGDATDETGTYNITLSGGAVQNSDHVDYDGVDDYGQCSRLAFNDNAFTMVFRFRLDALVSEGVWLANSRTSATGAGQEWQLNVYPVVSQKLRFNITNTLGDTVAISSLDDISTGVWYVYALRFTGALVEMFNESSLDSSAAFSGSMNTGASNTQFSKRGWNALPNYFGESDQSRGVAYDYALSDAELAAAVNKIKNGW